MEAETVGIPADWIDGRAPFGSKAQGALRIRKVERHLRPWRVEGLETKCGTGRHVTFHRTADEAITMTLVRLYQDHGIKKVTLQCDSQHTASDGDLCGPQSCSLSD